MEPLTGGQRFGHYELIRPLGAGGMGVGPTWARDIALDRLVAIKFVRHSEGAHDDHVARFLKEAQAVAALDHPGICAGAIDVGVDDAGRQYMVMQYIEGETLASRLVRGALTPRESLLLCTRITEVLLRPTSTRSSIAI